MGRLKARYANAWQWRRLTRRTTLKVAPELPMLPMLPMLPRSSGVPDAARAVWGVQFLGIMYSTCSMTDAISWFDYSLSGPAQENFSYLRW